MTGFILHITSAAAWDEARMIGLYRAASLDSEGFIHCSYRWQVAATANRIFQGRHDLVVMEIDPQLLTCPLVDENLEGGSERFPHIYGPLPMEAVLAVHPLLPDAAGMFTLPATLTCTAP